MACVATKPNPYEALVEIDLEVHGWIDPDYVAEDPLSCVARGAGQVLENFDQLQKTLASMQRGSTLH